jgi:hypothetical protein
MGLSFILKELVSATSLQSFAAGAALSATSLGTTFTILSTTQLTTTRLGTVTTSAAMLDDVVGLVMVQIISNLGGSAASFSAITVVRPVFVSIGFAVGLLLLCAFCLQPVLKKLLDCKDRFPAFVETAHFAFLAQTCVLVGIVAGATYSGTSSLFAAYLAGVIVSWFDGLVAEAKTPIPVFQSEDSQEPTRNHQGSTQNSKNRDAEETPSRAQSQEIEIPHNDTPTGELIYSAYYKEPVNRILLPLFFVSPSIRSKSDVLTSAGIHRIRNPHNQNVLRSGYMAWDYLRHADGNWKNDHRPMARSILSEPCVWSSLYRQETICIHSFLLCKSPDRQKKVEPKQESTTKTGDSR